VNYLVTVLCYATNFPQKRVPYLIDWIVSRPWL